MRASLAVLVTAAAIATAGEARAGEPRVLRLSVEGHLVCPSEAQVRRSLERRFGAGKIVLGPPIAGSLSLSLRAIRPGTLEMTLDDGSGTPPTRRRLSVRPDECASLADTVTLMVEGWLIELPWRSSWGSAGDAAPDTGGNRKERLAGAGQLPSSEPGGRSNESASERAPATAPASVPTMYFSPISRPAASSPTVLPAARPASVPIAAPASVPAAAPPVTLPPTREARVPPATRPTTLPERGPRPRVPPGAPWRLEVGGALAIAPEGATIAAAGALALDAPLRGPFGLAMEAQVATPMSVTLGFSTATGAASGSIHADRAALALLGRLSLSLPGRRAIRLYVGPALHLTYARSAGFTTDRSATFFDPALMGRAVVEQPLGATVYAWGGLELLVLAHREAFDVVNVAGRLTIPALWGGLAVGLGIRL